MHVTRQNNDWESKTNCTSSLDGRSLLVVFHQRFWGRVLLAWEADMEMLGITVRRLPRTPFTKLPLQRHVQADNSRACAPPPHTHTHTHPLSHTSLGGICRTKLPRKISNNFGSGKIDPVEVKGGSKPGPFCFKMGVLQAPFLLSSIGPLRENCLKNDKFVFQISLCKTPLKLDQVRIRTPPKKNGPKYLKKTPQSVPGKLEA